MLPFVCYRKSLKHNELYKPFPNDSLPLLILLLPVRAILLFFAQSILCFYHYHIGHEAPWLEAGKWWTVWGNFADLGCLLFLAVIYRREGIALINPFKTLKSRSVKKGLLFLLILVPCTAVGSVVASFVVYGNWHAELVSGALYGRHLPVWAILYSILVWTPIWSATEEMTYNGFFTSRIQKYTNRLWLTALMVCFWWAIQHSFLPFIPDLHYFAWRFISFIPCVLALVLLYIKTDDLQAVSVAHFFLDLGAIAATINFSL